MQNSSLPDKGKFFRIVFIGDIIGKFGRRFLDKSLPLIKIRYMPDLVIANGENSAGGLGITKNTAAEVFDAGVDIIDVAGAGGTNWARVEAARSDDPSRARLGFFRRRPGN